MGTAGVVRSSDNTVVDTGFPFILVISDPKP